MTMFCLLLKIVSVLHFANAMLKCLKSKRVRVVTAVEKIHKEKNLNIEREKKSRNYFF